MPDQSAIFALIIFITALRHDAVHSAFCKPRNKGNANSVEIVPHAVHLSSAAPSNVFMEMHATYMPAPEKVEFNGDCAYITSHDKQAFIIANGESSKSVECGSHPNRISRLFAKAVVNALSLREASEHSAIQTAITKLQSQGECGATNALFARKNGPKKLRIINLGDNRAIQLRLNRRTRSYTIVASTVQQWKSGSPIQFTANAFLHKGSILERLDEYNFEVESGDLLVAGTSGLWQTIGTTEIAAVASHTKLISLATVLIEMARAKEIQKSDLAIVVARFVSEDAVKLGRDVSNCHVSKLKVGENSRPMRV